MIPKQKNFITIVWDFYQTNGRNNLPWRHTKNPYYILVSEVMLQQTQVMRVLPKYNAFIQQFPTIESLAEASLADILILWQGLGYNRRAKMLHTCAQEVMSRYGSTLPDSHSALCALPGIGSYTAGAIMAFSYNEPIAMIETNIRTVYTHHLFSDEMNVTDKEILKLVEETIDIKNPRQWYWALMDYGAYLKKKHGSINRKSKHYTKQSKFVGSNRQIRGAIVRILTENKSQISRAYLFRELSTYENIRIDAQLKKLVQEGMVTNIEQRYHLPK